MICRSDLLTLLAVCVLSTSVARAQYSSKKNLTNALRVFENTTTLFVETGEDDYDTELRRGAEAHWTITPWRMLPADSFRTLLGDERYTFVFHTKLKPENPNKDFKLSALVLAPGGLHDVVLSESTAYAYVPVDDVYYERTPSDFAFRLEDMVSMLHDGVSSALALQINENHRYDNHDLLEDSVNTRAGALAGRTLVINNRYRLHKMPYSSAFEETLGESVEFVNQDELHERIRADEDIVYMISPSNCKRFIQVVEAATGRLLYTHVLEDTYLRDYTENIVETDILALKRAIARHDDEDDGGKRRRKKNGR